MASDDAPACLPLLTPDLPGSGGVIKQQPEDFRVEEMPLYEAAGSGPHLYLTVEKRGISTYELIRRAARLLGTRPADIGYAGLKDARAVAVQRISVPETASGTDLKSVPAALGQIDGVAVLKVERHGNKLKPGHLKGNRFRVVIRDVVAGAEERAGAVLGELERHGVPNGFDTQRFGRFRNSHRLGRLLLQNDGAGFAGEFLAPHGRERRDEILALLERGEYGALPEMLPSPHRAERRFASALARSGHPGAAVRVIEKRMRIFYLTAFQGYLFNLTLERRGIENIDRLWHGDLAYLHRNGAVFRVEDVEAESPRLDTFEISPSGPLFGRKAPLAEGKQGEIERSVAEEEGALPDAFTQKGLKLPGDRRPYRVPLLGPPEVEAVGRGPGAAGLRPDEAGPGALAVSFALPPGAYATLLLREIMESGT